MHLELRRPSALLDQPRPRRHHGATPEPAVAGVHGCHQLPGLPPVERTEQRPRRRLRRHKILRAQPRLAGAPGCRALLLPGLRDPVECRLDQVAAVVRRLRQVHHRRDRAHRVAPVVLAGVGEDRDGQDREPVASQLLPEPRRVRGHSLFKHRPFGDSAGKAAGDRAALAPGRHDLERQAGRRGRAVRR